MGAKWQKFSVDIPKDLKPTDRQLIAQEIIDHIIERTQDGKDANGRKFKKYTKEYAKEKGVGVNDVDLTLSSEMLESIKLISERSGKLIIGFENGSLENAKADGNIRGTYGKPTEDPSKARPFLGISKKDLKEIVSNYRSVSDELKAISELAGIAEVNLEF